MWNFNILSKNLWKITIKISLLLNFATCLIYKHIKTSKYIHLYVSFVNVIYEVSFVYNCILIFIHFYVFCSVFIEFYIISIHYSTSSSLHFYTLTHSHHCHPDETNKQTIIMVIMIMMLHEQYNIVVVAVCGCSIYAPLWWFIYRNIEIFRNLQLCRFFVCIWKYM